MDHSDGILAAQPIRTLFVIIPVQAPLILDRGVVMDLLYFVIRQRLLEAKPHLVSVQIIIMRILLPV
jgi:hypothetical protein